MSKKVGRNDPCPCGSGKKFKQCHGRVEQEAPSEDSHEGAVERSLAWLELYHRKAWASAYEEEIGALVFDGLDEELDEAIADVLETLEPELRAAIYVNVTEWLLAEGEIAVKGERRRVTDLLLGPSGPALSPGQRDWVAQFAQQPLRLYEVTEVVPGSITVRDAVDAAEPPIVVTEHAGSESIVAGSLIATRVMTVSVGRQFSGAMYPFLDDSGLQLLAELRRQATHPSPIADDDRLMAGFSIMQAWIAMLVRPELPMAIVEERIGEGSVFVIDRYEVRSWPELEAALAAQGDVAGSREGGWERFVIDEDGRPQELTAILVEPDRSEITLVHPKGTPPDPGRAWFEAIVGAAVVFLSSEMGDFDGRPHAL